MGIELYEKFNNFWVESLDHFVQCTTYFNWHTHLQVTQMSMLSDFGEPRHYRFSFKDAKS